MNELTMKWLISLIAILFVGSLWTMLTIATNESLYGIIGLAILYRKVSRLTKKESTE